MNFKQNPLLVTSTNTFYSLIENGRNDRMARAFKENFALAIRDYLWNASIGEARHAWEQADYVINNIPPLSDRKFVYDVIAPAFPPSKANIDILKKIFSYQWFSPSFGGKKWKRIVEHVEMFGSVSNDLWIDIAIHLQHNSGTVFNKIGLVFDDLMSGDLSLMLAYLNHRAVNSVYKFPYSIGLFSPLFPNKEKEKERYGNKGNIYFYSWNWNHVKYSSSTFSIAQREKFYCSCCGASTYVYKTTKDGKNVCKSCFYKFAKCHDCQELINKEDAFYNHMTGTYFCNDCYEEHKTKCNHCGKEIYGKDALIYNYGIYCPDCIVKKENAFNLFKQPFSVQKKITNQELLNNLLNSGIIPSVIAINEGNIKNTIKNNNNDSDDDVSEKIIETAEEIINEEIKDIPKKKETLIEEEKENEKIQEKIKESKESEEDHERPE